MSISAQRIEDRSPTADEDVRLMGRALELAHEARRAGEVPVGALVVLDGRIVGAARNASIEMTDPTAHAEVLALRRAAQRVGNYRLNGATLYCTVEPCLMCLGSMLHARVERLVYGADDQRVGAMARLDALRGAGASFNHRIRAKRGILAEEAGELLRGFFRERRPGATPGPETTTPNGEVPKWS